MTSTDVLRAAGAAWPGRGPDPHFYPETVDRPVLEAFAALYEAHRNGLAETTAALRDLQPRFEEQGAGMRFFDVEGELLYLLLRDLRPATVWEMSPAAGWSTNYILAALTHNGSGALRSFERTPEIGGVPTADAVRSNLHASFDAERLTIHVGDAQQEVARHDEEIDVLFVDSCHEAWFAEWYLAELVPRARRLVLIHDVVDRSGRLKHVQYPDGEPYAVVEWLQREGVRAVPLAGLEDPAFTARAGLPERRGAGSLAIAFAATGGSVRPGPRPRDLVRKADLATLDGDHDGAHDLLREAEALATGHAPHVLLQIAERYERLGRPFEARRLLAAAVERHGDSGFWLYVAARYARRLGAPHLAARYRLATWRKRDAPGWTRPSAAIRRRL